MADALAGTRGRWWIIGSAAVSLLGADAGVVRDVDLLLEEPEEAHALLARWDLPAAPGRSDARFRSAIFGCWAGAPLPVEVMAGFDARDGWDWSAVLPTTREPAGLDGRLPWTPARVELAALFRRFGREKDLARAAALAG